MGKNKKTGQKPNRQTAKLELLEDYNPNKSKMPRRSRGKGRMERVIAAAEKDKERAEAGLPPTQLAPVDKAANDRLKGLADELGVEIDWPTNVKRLAFNDNRKAWRSLENSVEKPRDFLKWYGAFQERKLDPKVFACETPGTRQEAQYIAWYQKNRFQYYERKDRLGELRALENVKDWPNMPDIMTSAPFVRTAISEHKYVESAKNHDHGLFKLLNVKDVAHTILGDLAKTGYLDLSNLSRTCHTGLNIVSQYIEHWDETAPGDFLGEDICVDDDDKVQRTPVTLLISPVRKAFNPEDGKRPDTTYSEQYMVQVKLYRALNNRADLITNLQLHRLQFLDVNAVGCILTSLRNLKLLGIYQCPLLHLGKMSHLLRMIERRGKGEGPDKSFVDLDFFPMYHEGPNSILRLGSFGAVWNHPGCDMATGIWQMVLYELYPKATKLGIDILSWGRAFRLFLEKLPMLDWANVRIVEAIKSLEYTGQEKIKEFDLTLYNKAEGKWERFADDVTAALRGDGTEPAIVPGHQLSKVVKGYQPERQRKYGWWRDTKRCTRCREKVLAVFCPFGENRCWGCLAKAHLSKPWDHHLTFKAHAVETWFGRSRNLNHIVKPGAEKSGYLIAQIMDDFRRREMESNFGGEGSEDWVDHYDFGRLHRRYARHCEAHGPVDRKLNDRQYMPIGHFETGITSVMAPVNYPDFKIAVLMREWEVVRNKQHPRESSALRAQAKQKELETITRDVQSRRQEVIDECNQDDARKIEEQRQHFERRLRWPNRQIKCWDELIQEMFHREHKAQPPQWVVTKRPFPLNIM